MIDEAGIDALLDRLAATLDAAEPALEAAVGRARG